MSASDYAMASTPLLQGSSRRLIGQIPRRRWPLTTASYLRMLLHPKAFRYHCLGLLTLVVADSLDCSSKPPAAPATEAVSGSVPTGRSR